MSRSSALALLLVAFLLGGCGLTGSAKKGPPPKTLSHAQLVHAVKQASKRFVRQAKRVHFEAGTSFVKVERAERTIVIPAYEHLLFTLQGLTPPPADAAGYRGMLGSLN